MPAKASALRAVARTSLVGGLLAVLIGLPVAVDVNTTLDSVHGIVGLAPRGSGSIIADRMAIAEVPGLILESAYISKLGGAGTFGKGGRQLLLDGARLSLHLGGLPSAAGATPSGTMEGRLARLDVDALLLRHAELEIKAGDGRSWRLTDVTAEIGRARKGGGRSVAGLATYAGQRLKISLDWWQEGERPAVRARIEGGLVEASLDGHASARPGARFTGTLGIEARKLRAFARWLGVPVEPGQDLLDARITGPVEWADGTLNFTRASVSLDGNEGTGTLALKTGQRPSIEGTLGFDTIDVSRYIASVLAPPEAADQRHRLARTGVRPLIAVVDADLRLSAGRVVTPSLETGRAAVTVTVRHGRLQADLAELEVERGRAAGQISLDAATGSTHRIVLKGRISDVDPGRVFAPHLKRNPLFGRANVAVDLAGSGATLAETITGLSGKGTFTLTDGGKLGLDLRSLLYAAQTSQIVGWSAAGKGSTSLDTLDGRFSIANGGITIDQLAARSGATSWQGSGKVDLAERLLDLVLTLGPAASDATQTMREALAIRGTWFDPAISLLRQPVNPAGAVGNILPTPSVQVRE